VLQGAPLPIALQPLGWLPSHAAQGGALVPVLDSGPAGLASPHRYALVLLANYYGRSTLALLQPAARPQIQPLAQLQVAMGGRL
jgi:hypothetical protein